jgi:hypothetical protein
MDRSRLTVLGGSLAGIGVLLAALSLGLPWAYAVASTRVDIVGLAGSRTRAVSLFDLEGGGWFLTVLLLLLATGTAAVLIPAPVARAAGIAGGALAGIGLVVIVAVWPDTHAGATGLDLFGLLRTRTEVSVGPGAPVALVATTVLGWGILVLGFATELAERGAGPALYRPARDGRG